MTNVVTAQINSQILVFVIDSSVRVLEAKVRTVSDQLIDLVPSSQANAFSLTNLPVGVYILDVMTQKGNAKAAYEGILVLGQEPINPQTQTIIEWQIIREERDDEDDDRDCDPSYPTVCIPPPPPILNCDDISFRNFKVTGNDPHGLDGNNDGIGCESNSPQPQPDPCIENSDLPGCPVDCEGNPDDPRCPVEGGDICEVNPDAEGCPPRDCDQNPDLPECQEPSPEAVGEGDTDGGDEGDTGGGDEGGEGEN
jgi:hypothetical protein